MRLHGFPRGKTAKYVVQVEDSDGWHAVTNPITNRARAFRLRDVLNSRGEYRWRVFNKFTRRESFEKEETV